MRFPVRRVLLGFAVGAGAGWVAGLLRKPAAPPPGSGAETATRMPVEEFGEPTETPGTDAPNPDDIAQEPTAPAEAFEAVPGAGGEAGDAVGPGAGGEAGDAGAPDAGGEADAGGPDDTPPPRKATGPAVKRPPGSRRTAAAARTATPGASEPATAPEVGAEQTEQPAKPRRRRAAKPVDVDAAAALREGHQAATERLFDAEAEATPPPEDPTPAARRRRRPARPAAPAAESAADTAPQPEPGSG